MIMLITYLIWRFYLAAKVFHLWCIFYNKIFHIESDLIFDIDNQVQVPRYSPTNLMIMTHYMFLSKFPELTELIIAIIDADIDENLTIECAKMLMIISTIPHRIREKLFNVDIKNLALASKPFLCELQYEMNRLEYNKEDIDISMRYLEEQKQKTKIYLYAFSNSMCDTSYFSHKFSTLINYTIVCHNYKSMSEYAIEGNPRSSELIDSYRDFLNKYAGDFLLGEYIMAKNTKTKFQLLKTIESEEITQFDVEKPYFDITDTKNENYSNAISNQKILDKVPLYPYLTSQFLSYFVIFMFIFPIFSSKIYVNSSKFVSYEYFNSSHSPFYFKISMEINNVENFFNSYNKTLKSDNSLYNELDTMSFTTIQKYLSAFTCKIDDKPILDIDKFDFNKFNNNYYNILSRRLILSKSDPNNFENLKKSHIEFEKLSVVIENISNRYCQCALLMKTDTPIFRIIIPFIITLFAVSLFWYCTVFLTRKYLLTIVKILEGIETSTIEEFRSKLYIQINTMSISGNYNDFDIDNDGALELEELEDNYNYEHIGRDDFTDIIDNSLDQPIILNIFDPGRPDTYMIYTTVIFAVRYIMIAVVMCLYNRSKSEFVSKAVELQGFIQQVSNLYFEFDSLLSNISTYNDNLIIIPQKIMVNFSDKNLLSIFDKWNNFIDKNDFTVNKSLEIIQNLSNEAIQELNNLQQSYNIRIDTSDLKFIDFFYWFVVFTLILLFCIITYRYILNVRNVMTNARHLVLILHSKYSSTESNMINALNPFSSKSDKINLTKMSEIIVSQMRESVIFFDNDLKITGCNQQSTVDFGLTSDKLITSHLTNLLDIERNRDFYEYIDMMSKPLGVCTRKIFTLFSKSDIEFQSVLIPLKNQEEMHFSLMMRNMSDINQLKKEFKFEQQKLNTLLWRLVPQKISEKFLSDNLKDIIVGKNCALMCSTAKSAAKPELRLTELDITEIIMSLSDKIMSQNKNIMRLRTFNGTFLFIAGLFEEKSRKENIEDLIKFCDECGKKVSDIFKKKQSLCGLIKSGIVYGYMSGISKTIFDVLSDSAIEVFDLIDVVPAGKLCILKEEYEAINDANKRFVAYLPPRDVDVELFINRGE